MDIDLRNIHKHFGRVRANDGVDLSVATGTIHGILGENGAGKSTLMKILAGQLQPDSGSVHLDGKTVAFDAPRVAMACGIGMLYQEPMDFPALSVLDNFILGRPAAGPRAVHRQRFLTLAADAGFQLNPDTMMDTLSVGERQQVEIIRLMAMGIRLLILDEPTTGISTEQKIALFDALRGFADGGRTVLLVSHKLEDVETLCDAITVLRQGRVSGQAVPPFDTASLLEMMFHTLPTPLAAERLKTGARVLHLSGVSVAGGRSGLKACALEACEREIVGLAGLEGSGQGELLRAAAGLAPLIKGRVRVGDRDLTGMPYDRFQSHGVAFLPADRLQEGLIAGLTIAEHAALMDRSERFFSPWRRAAAPADKNITDFQIAGAPDTPVTSLSGGNQQRLMLSFLPATPRLLLLENPTRGLDVESARWIWSHLHRLCRHGTCIVFSSSELDEIMTAASRILVFFDGRLILDTPAAATTVQALGNAIAGNVHQ